MTAVSRDFSANLPEHASCLEKIGLWIHKHSTVVKVVEISAIFFGALLLLTLPFTAPFLGVVVSILTGVAGAGLVAIGTVAYCALGILIPPHREMSDHVFAAGSYSGGKLYYEGDVPILSINSDSPFAAGKAQGYLCGSALSKLSRRLNFVLHTLGGYPKPEEMAGLIAQLREKVPQRYLQEIEGIVAGYNEWAEEASFCEFPRKITADELLLMQLMPDTIHLNQKAFVGNDEVTPHSAVACTSIVDKDPKKGFNFDRNMDWPPFGEAYSLVIHRKYTDGRNSTVEVGVPGLVGTLTGMNDQRLAIAMNVCGAGESTKTVRGLPAGIYNREILETCGSVAEADSYVRSASPLGPYHLTTVDPVSAKTFHFYQSRLNRTVIREWDGKPLVTLNCRYNPSPHMPMHRSTERQAVIDNFFKKPNHGPVSDVLREVYVNNWITTQKVHMCPQAGEFSVAFDNAFAGDTPLHPVPIDKLLFGA